MEYHAPQSIHIGILAVVGTIVEIIPNADLSRKLLLAGRHLIILNRSSEKLYSSRS